MLNKVKTYMKTRGKYLIADGVSLFIFMVGSSITASFFAPEYTAGIFFGGGLLHGKLSKPLEEKLVEKIK